MFERGQSGGDVTVMEALIEGLDEIFLRVEVVVGVTERHAGFLGHSAHRGFVVPTLAKHLEGSLEDQRLRLIAFDGLRCLLLTHLISPVARLIWQRFCEINETTRFVVGSNSGAASRYDHSR